MQNRVLANDWLESGKKHLEVAEILFKNGHYTDIVGIELQQSIERILKAVLAYNNLAITRTHDLAILLEVVKSEIEFDENIREQCEIATDYFIDNRYPVRGSNFLPSEKEIEKVIESAHFIYNTVNEYINK
ncbi:MAG: HEPN domain-containing protein [Bacteroidia bacterium]|nr:HEPN domain-containing protein [Bacteroidia bacterium]